jgi:FMN phosphatase YigB (HAD superfamily)
VGCRIEEDIAPARRLGFRTALFVGDKEAVRAKSAQLADPRLRPDVLLTDLTQLRECLAGNT